MKGKRVLSMFLSAAIGASAAAGVSITQEKIAAARTTEIDYIGSSTQAETFDNYSGTGWTSIISTKEVEFSSSVGDNERFGLVNVTEISKPVIGGTISSDYSNYPTYATGSALETQVRGKDNSAATTYILSSAVTEGKLYFSTDLYGHFDNTTPYGLTLTFYDDKGNTVAYISTDSMSSTTPDTYLRLYNASKGQLDRTENSVDWRGKQVTAFNVGLIFDLDNDKVTFSADYINTSLTRTTATNKNGKEQNLTISNIASFKLSYSGQDKNKNFAWAFDNTKLYNTYIESPATGISVSYQYDKTAISSKSIDISSNKLSAGESYAYYAPAYIEKDSKLYKTAGENHSRTAELTAGTTNVTEPVTLAASEGYQYAELDGAEPYGGAEYASNGAVKLTGTADTELLTVAESGKYNITIATGLSGGGTETTGTLKTESKTIKSDLAYGSTVNTTTIEGVFLSKDDVITSTANASNAAVDYILIEKTSNPATALEIKYNYNGNTLRTDTVDITSQQLTAGDTATYSVPAYFAGDDGNLYKTSNSTDDHGTLYQHRASSISAGTTTVTENVSLSYEKGTYQFVEFDGSDPVGHTDHASNGKVSNTGSSYKLLTVEDEGIYDITLATGIVRGGDSFTGTLTSNGKTVVSDLTYGTYANAKTYTGVHLAGSKDLTITGSDSRAATDYVLIVKTGDYTYPEATHSPTERKMENLGRGTYAVYTGSGVYLSWRLLGNESLANQAFDIYRDRSKIYTTGVHDATNYTDASGTTSSSYIVVPKGESISGETAVTPGTHYGNVYNTVQNTRNIFSYFDIPISQPAWTTPAPSASDNTAGGSSSSDKQDDDGGDSDTNMYTANDASVGDLDGDGEYEIILKWNPTNAKDNSNGGLTSNVIIDAYKLNGTKLWRIDLGKNIRAGAHYTQFMVYDFDGDGKAEVAMKTAPGSVDGKGAYVNAVMDRDLTDADDNEANYRNSNGYILSGPEYLTVFDGETGKALATTDFISRGNVSDWGDSYGNRVDRFLAGVAYLDGVHPSIIMTRGYYAKSVAAAYSWDGESIKKIWLHEGTASASGTLTTYDDEGNVKAAEALASTIYGQGNHSLGVCDADNDGKDEIVFGSAIIDDNGRILNNTEHGHGDAHHISDFNNDGYQEIFSVHEDKSISALGYADELRSANTGTVIAGHAASIDNGRGIMDNFLDNTAYGLAQFWSTGFAETYNQAGTQIASNRADDYPNSAIYWDADLGRELLNGHSRGAAYFDKPVISDTTISAKRFYFGTDSNGSYPNNVGVNNNTKANACLTADILGDWREEVILRGSDNTFLRVFVSAAPTEYRLYTLMHDSQYRTGVAIENVGYNQPPHTSYYIGSAALAADTDGTTLNYLAPAVAFTNADPVEVPELITVSATQGENVTDRKAGYWDMTAKNTIHIPSDVTISADNITITIGGIEATKGASLANKLQAISGGNVELSAAIVDIPNSETLSDVEFGISISYIVNETAKKTAASSVTIK